MGEIKPCRDFKNNETPIFPCQPLRHQNPVSAALSTVLVGCLGSHQSAGVIADNLSACRLIMATFYPVF